MKIKSFISQGCSFHFLKIIIFEDYMTIKDCKNIEDYLNIKDVVCSMHRL